MIEDVDQLLRKHGGIGVSGQVPHGVAAVGVAEAAAEPIIS